MLSPSAVASTIPPFPGPSPFFFFQLSQHQHTMQLVPGDILTVLFSRTDPGTFHWAICIPCTPTSAYKLHAKQVTEHWFFEDPIPRERLLQSPIASAGIRIGRVQRDTDIETIEKLLKSIPMAIPDVDQGVEPRFSCRVWWKEAVRQLHIHGYIFCPDVNALEAQGWKYGLSNDASQPTYRGYLQYDCAP